jgi:hypothetical protein
MRLKDSDAAALEIVTTADGEFVLEAMESTPDGSAPLISTSPAE